MFLFNLDNPIKLILADDHEIVRAGIRRLLSFDKVIDIIDEAANGADAIELVRKHRPNVALLDILMPRMNGIEATKNIKDEFPETFVVMLTAFEDAEHLDNALKAGADGYLSKEISAKELHNAIRQVVEGYRVFSKTILDIINKRYFTYNEVEEPTITITKREQEILNLIAQGKTSGEIANLLKLSIRTIETHRYNLISKLNLKNAAELIRYAVLHS